jgi:branched-chain amino acid aminotransferase
MPFGKTEKIWMNGKLVDWDKAQVHVLTHALHYGSSWFEGIRCYNTEKGSAIFRLRPHIKRLQNSAKMFRATIPYSLEDLENACIETIKANKMVACYIRPIVYRGYGDVGVNPFNNPVDVSIAVWDWEAYLGGGALENGVDVCVSSWRRAAPDTFPSMSKSSGNYLNSQLIKMEAIVYGFVEGIALDAYGNISEGSGENIFIVNNGKIFTPPFGASILPGVTRDSVIQLSKELGYELVEQMIPREMLYTADEVFFSGTAAEITPIKSIDKIPVGNGKPGEVTRRLQKVFFEIVRKGVDTRNWLTLL